MSIYEEKGALTFYTYQRFLEMIKSSEPKLHKYLEDTGFVINDEKNYASSISKVVYPRIEDRECWESAAKNFKYVHLVNFDSFCSELLFLSDSVASDGTVLFCGCGNGDEIEWIKRNTKAKVIGLDYARNMLKEYCNRNKSDIILATCEGMPLKDNSANQIILNGVRARSATNLLSEVNRVLTPEGEVRINSVFKTEIVFPQHRENILDAIRKASYDEFMKSSFERAYGNDKAKEEMGIIVEAFVYNDLKPQNLLALLTLMRFEAGYDFSRLPVIPRGYRPQCQKFQVSYAITGKKTKAS
jgi:ubiquinone/menaquinone biosynthesis C-methylase UbiE